MNLGPSDFFWRAFFPGQYRAALMMNPICVAALRHCSRGLALRQAHCVLGSLDEILADFTYRRGGTHDRTTLSTGRYPDARRPYSAAALSWVLRALIASIRSSKQEVGSTRYAVAKVKPSKFPSARGSKPLHHSGDPRHPWASAQLRSASTVPADILPVAHPQGEETVEVGRSAHPTIPAAANITAP